MDRRAIQRRRRQVLAVAALLVVAVALLGVLFGRRWRQELLLRALGSADDAKVAWATARLKKQPDKGVALLLREVGRRGERFDLRVVDYLEEIGRAEGLPLELKVRAAVAKLSDPVVATAGFARLLQLPPQALEPLLTEARALEGLALHRAALACAKMAPQACRERARRLVEEDSPGARRLGLALVGALGEEAGSALLSKGLTDPDPSVRAEAAYDLALLSGREALPQLARLLRDPSPEVRRAALAAAEKVAEAEDGRFLAAALTDPEESVRAEAVFLLASIGAQDQLEAVCGLAEDPSPRVRQAVAVALEALHGEGDLEVLLKLSEDGSVEVRRAAAYALGKRAQADEALQALLRLARDESLQVVQAAYQVLVESRRPEVLEFFISELSEERPSWARDPLPPEVAGAPPKPVPVGALAACALRWLTGKEFGYHWRAPAEERRRAQERWRRWLSERAGRIDLERTPTPEGLTNYEQLLKRMPWPPKRP